MDTHAQDVVSVRFEDHTSLFKCLPDGSSQHRCIQIIPMNTQYLRVNICASMVVLPPLSAAAAWLNCSSSTAVRTQGMKSFGPHISRMR